jgi:hypothetical protein
MLTKLHCSCGHSEAVAPKAVGRQIRCKACAATLSFSDGGPVHWFVVGNDGESAECAIPIPLGMPLKIGSAAGSWIVVPSEVADDSQVELTQRPDGGLAVRHQGKDKAKGTWINQARILTGVLHDGDVLRLGSWTAQLTAHAAVLAMLKPVDCDVVVEEAVYEEEPAAEPAGPVYTDTVEPGGSRFRTLQVSGCLVVILFAGLYLMRSTIWPGVSSEMPRETTYHCPVDGTVFRAAWTGSTPRCPQCGQLCIGPMRYKAETDERKPAAKTPKSDRAATKAASDTPAKAASGGIP